jgi:hypothetical protein
VNRNKLLEIVKKLMFENDRKVPDLINTTWKAPKYKPNVQWQKTFSFGDLKSDESQMTKRIFSAVKMSQKHKIGYIVHLNGNSHPIEKNALLSGTYFYVYAENNTAYISKFTI